MFRWFMNKFLPPFIVLAIVGVAFGATMREGSQRRIDGIVIPAKVTTWGVTLIADSVDSVWVQVDFPYASSAGAKRDSVVAEIAHMQQTYKYYATSTVGRYRLRFDNAKRVIERLTNYIP